MQTRGPAVELSDSNFGAFMDAAPVLRPDPSTVVGVNLWGTTWPCSFDADGRIQWVKTCNKWMPARAALQDVLCDALERNYREMPQ